MSAPMKPWEKDFGVTPGIDQRIRLESSASLPAMMGPARPVRSQVPSVPTRPWLSRTQPRVNSYGYGTSSPYMLGGYSGYGGYTGYGGYGAYGTYGGYRNFGTNRFGIQGPEDPENRFIQIAEEAARPAFDSIQSVVDAFGSVSFMLESTYQAVVHTFRAVLGIAEHLGQLRSIFAALNIFRLVRWAYRKLCQLLGVKSNAFQDSIWQDAAANVENIPTGLPTTESSAPKWPIFVYFTIVVSGPLLMWRLLKSLSLGNIAGSRVWDPKTEPSSQFAMVLYPFMAQTDRELNVIAGKMVALAPSQYQTNWSSGWALVATDRGNVGFVPVNYMQQVQHPLNTKQAAGYAMMSETAASTNRETAPQQHVNTFPVVTNDVNTLKVPVVSPAGCASSLDQLAATNGASVSDSMTSKLDPTSMSSGDMLPTLPVPLDNDASQLKNSSSKTVGVRQTVPATELSSACDKAS